MKKRGDATARADQVWQIMVHLVMDSRGDWRKKVTEATGFPFSRIRALRRLLNNPLTMKELADAASMDAPATTVAVNYLEERGLVERYAHPENRRAKLVRITTAGRRIAAIAHKVDDDAPGALSMLSSEDLAALDRILSKVAAHAEE